jgi:[protein-PII] uridylyltransferase
MTSVPASPDPQSLKREFARHKAGLLASIAASGPSSRAIKTRLVALAKATDQILSVLWQQSAMPTSWCLVAVGGYGRGELFPYSDVDVLLLIPNGTTLPDHSPLKSQLEQFISNCWDIGLEIGSSVRTVNECLREAAQDITIQTSLLEARFICGRKLVFNEFTKLYQAQLNPRVFFTAKTLEMQQRHTKQENTPYSLEPNCKESPGGLRDLHVLLWVAKAAGLGKSWEDLARNGIITRLEAKQLKATEALLSLVRARLHLAAKRREDRLVFDLQHAVAESFGYGYEGDGTSKSARKASEALMKRYYWNAKAVVQLNQIVLLNIEEHLNPAQHTPVPINEYFFNKGGMIEVANEDLYLQHPHAILETFLLYQTNGGLNGLSARTYRALYNARKVMDSKWRNDPINKSLFRRMLQTPEGITHAMRLMNQTSVLGRYLWVFRRIVGQMQHDLFHVYTVDQHILMVLRNMRRFFMAEHAHEYPSCSQLAAGWDKPWVLYTAALFHDIAKGRGGDHSELGAVEVRRFCRQHDIDDDDARLIEFLVHEHLHMSRIAQKEDLGDPDVIAAFARRVGNERNLTALYLLTVADIRGTSPKVWNAWKGKLLEDLYRLTLRALGGRAPDAAAQTEQRKREALKLLALYALPFEAEKKLWATLDVSYFMRHDASDIAWHVRMISRQMGSRQAVVRARLSPIGEGMQVLVYTPDQSDLFARICSYFDQESLSIQDARIHTVRAEKTTPDGPSAYALDTFQITSPTMGEHYRELMPMIESGLTLTLGSTVELPLPTRGRVSRRVRSFPIQPRVTLVPDEKGQHWLLSVCASDRVGLLYSIARVLARYRVNLQLAKISTLGERVEDTFLIDGPALQDSRLQIAIETEILEAVSG